MEDTYIIIPRHIVGNLALGAVALHELGLSAEEADSLLATLALNEDILEGIGDFIEEHAVGEFNPHTIMKETNLG